MEAEVDDIVDDLLDYYATIEEEEEEDGTGSVITTANLEPTDSRPLEASPTRVSHISSSSLVTRSPHASNTSLESVSSISSISSSTTFHSTVEQLDTDIPTHLEVMHPISGLLSREAIQQLSQALEQLRA
jgi:hypothetical protein